MLPEVICLLSQATSNFGNSRLQLWNHFNNTCLDEVIVRVVNVDAVVVAVRAVASIILPMLPAACRHFLFAEALLASGEEFAIVGSVVKDVGAYVKTWL